MRLHNEEPSVVYPYCIDTRIIFTTFAPQAERYIRKVDVMTFLDRSITQFLKKMDETQKPSKILIFRVIIFPSLIIVKETIIVPIDLIVVCSLLNIDQANVTNVRIK